MTKTVYEVALVANVQEDSFVETALPKTFRDWTPERQKKYLKEHPSKKKSDILKGDHYDLKHRASNKAVKGSKEHKALLKKAATVKKQYHGHMQKYHSDLSTHHAAKRAEARRNNDKKLAEYHDRMEDVHAAKADAHWSKGN